MVELQVTIDGDGVQDILGSDRGLAVLIEQVLNQVLGRLMCRGSIATSWRFSARFERPRNSGPFSVSTVTVLRPNHRRWSKKMGYFMRSGRLLPLPTTIVAFATLLLACADVQQTMQPLEDLATWSAERTLEIGREDDPDYALSRAGTVLVTSAGEVLVTQPQENRIRVFDREGTFLRAIGREGEGPGEFRSLARAGLVNDTLWVSERGRMQFLNPAGEVLRTKLTTTPRPDPPFLTEESYSLADGWRMVPAMPAIGSRDADGPAPHFLIVGPNDAINDTIPLGNLSERVTVDASGGMPASLFVPFTFNSYFAISPSGRSIIRIEQKRAATGVAGSLRVIRHSHRGPAVNTADIPYVPQIIDEAVVDSIVTAEASRLANRFASSAVAREAIRSALDLPETYLAVDEVVIARDGRVWLRRQGPADLGWLVLDPELRPEARVLLPAGFDLMSVVDGELWGVELGPFDVPRIVRYTLEMPSDE